MDKDQNILALSFSIYRCGCGGAHWGVSMSMCDTHTPLRGPGSPRSEECIGRLRTGWGLESDISMTAGPSKKRANTGDLSAQPSSQGQHSLQTQVKKIRPGMQPPKLGISQPEGPLEFNTVLFLPVRLLTR